MSKPAELRNLKTHFAFGRNWSSYAELIDESKIEAAKTGLTRLVPGDEIAGRSFLDIGCGSGLHALAAARLGANAILACDLDPESVRTAREVLTRHAGKAKWAVKEVSVFDLESPETGKFDIVYSWGVLHHTGDMDSAIRATANRVAPGGLFAIALYRRTWLDGFWRREKRWYANASPWQQNWARLLFDGMFRAVKMLTGKNPAADRGMDYWHDVHDWLGGYPYESILAPEVEELMQSLAFSKVRVIARGRDIGIFGSGCDEYVYRAPKHTGPSASE